MSNKNTNDRKTLRITDREYDALSHIRGLQAEAHMMVMTATLGPKGGYILEGRPKAFDELVFDLSDEISYELSPPPQLRQLSKLYSRLSPDDFL